MRKNHRPNKLCALLATAWLGAFVFPVAAEPVVTPGDKSLPLPGESFKLDGHDAFLILPPDTGTDIPWVWYAPTLKGLPSKSENWMFERFLKAGVAIAGIDVGESFGSPEGRGVYQDFHGYLVKTRKFGSKPCLLARSRGGLMLYSWAVEHPESVGGVAGIYPVCDIASYPGIGRAAGAYGMTAKELEAKITDNNPIDRLKPLADAKVPVLHLHGDDDKIVPLEANSAELVKRYQALGGPAELDVFAGQGHNMWNGWFQSQKLTDFVIARALGDEGEAPGPVIEAGKKVALTGVLTGGLMAIGGETTGWKLTYSTGRDPAEIEVDMSAIKAAEKFDSKKVTAAGTVVSKHYVERGAVLILKVRSVVPSP